MVGQIAHRDSDCHPAIGRAHACRVSVQPDERADHVLLLVEIVDFGLGDRRVDLASRDPRAGAAASGLPSRARSPARAAMPSSTSLLNRPNWIVCSRPLTASAMRCASATSKRCPASAARIAAGDLQPADTGSAGAPMRALPAAACASAARAAASAGSVLTHGAQHGKQRLVVQRLQPHDLAARADRRQQPARANATTRTNSVRAGGSSRLFSSALDAALFMSSAGSTMTTR